MKQSRQGLRKHTARRILVNRYVTGHPAQTHEVSPRQLPTDHDHDGGRAPIRGYQSDQPSHTASLGPCLLCFIERG